MGSQWPDAATNVLSLAAPLFAAEPTPQTPSRAHTYSDYASPYTNGRGKRGRGIALPKKIVIDM